MDIVQGLSFIYTQMAEIKPSPFIYFIYFFINKTFSLYANMYCELYENRSNANYINKI